MTITWTVEELDITDRPTAARVLEVQRAAYAIEAALIGYDPIPGRYEALQDLVATSSRLEWSGIRSGGTIVAAMSMSTDAGTVDIDRLVVDPAWFRLGLARALIASLPLSAVVTVSTGSDNRPGIALYESVGFTAVWERPIAPDVMITHFRRLAG